MIIDSLEAATSVSPVAKAVDPTFNAAESPYEVAVKIQGGDGWELNIWSTFTDLTRLRGIREAIWNERSSIAAGRSAGAQVFWCADADTATIDPLERALDPDDAVDQVHVNPASGEQFATQKSKRQCHRVQSK